jgi:hypothetical protein
MASGLRRALIWLGLVQPEGSVGFPFRPSYVCSTCGAMAAEAARERHDAWHQEIGG